jgi:hypothetical protein
MTPPSYPLRPVNGGPLPNARPKTGNWSYEPKLNGWRAWVHTPTGTMFNRKNEPLSIAKEFAPVLDRLRASRLPLVWLDVEALERRHNLGRGSLVVLDFAPGTYEGGYHLPPTLTYNERQTVMYEMLNESELAVSWDYLHHPPPEDSLLTFPYAFTDYGIPAPSANASRPEPRAPFPGEDLDGIHTGWHLLQQVNRALQTELFEGFVAKRTDSKYPCQLRSPDQEFPYWMKHRWQF